MEHGLAKQMVYGNGEGNTVTHHYAGATPKKTKKYRKKPKKACNK